MRAAAKAKNVRMSARKMRLVIDQIRGRDVNEAYALLQFSKKKAARPVGKVLRSAVANAAYRADEEGEAVDVDELYVREAYVDEGRTLRRWRPRAYGRATPVLKRSSHVTVVVETRD
ncbi:50S ribosomal protein L22 [Candidatus Palauibacter sp.]|jgi:large subunit ribosomal protein L22|uniref:50S ribosomal protein L22 n=1 Tax=Candidatus Palauibacter sp. TaxID=3101350 RepID=UPI003B01E9E3